MSQNPPNGPPPPYYGYPPPPGAYAYVPAPMMMPVYHPPPPPPAPEPTPPTYVTNHIYHPPVVVEEIRFKPPRVQSSKPWNNIKTTAELGLMKGLTWLGNSLQNINNKLIDWVPATTSDVHTLQHKAFVAGKEAWDGSPLCVVRAHHNGEFIPGKLAIKHRSAYVPHAGREVPVHNFEVLCAPPHAVRWVPSNNGQIPPGAIAAGNTHSAEPLYVGRVNHMRSVTPGKVHPSHGCCYISFSGSEISYKNYEVLCRVVG